MKKLELLVSMIVLSMLNSNLVLGQAPTSAWINEFHYDNTGGDVGEFVEIIVNESFTDLAKLKLNLYNGSNGTVYDSLLLSSFTAGATQDGFTIYSHTIAGIQNGNPDGLAIDYNGTLISGQFLSYGGTFNATDGPANGLGSTDIGVSEGTSTPIGNSLFLTGTGTQYSDFTWTSGAASAGSANTSQFLPVELTSFSAAIIDSKMILNWRTETEVNNYGFEIERSQKSNVKSQTSAEWVMIGFVDEYGNSNSPKEYSFVDEHVIGGKYSYQLKQIDNDNTIEYSKVIEVDMDAPIRYELSQNYPNPFNPETTIRFTTSNAGFVNLSLYNILGELKGSLVNEFKEAGVHSVRLNASQLNSGIYFYKLEVNDFVQMRKMNLIK